MNKVLDAIRKAKKYVAYLDQLLDVLIGILEKFGGSASTMEFDAELQAKIDALEE